jgi:CTP synthase
VALTYVIEPQALGEQKSKAAQLGIKRLMEAGVQPHIIACRAGRNEVTDKVLREDRDVQQCADAARVLHARSRDRSTPSPSRCANPGLDLRDPDHSSACTTGSTPVHEDKARKVSGARFVDKLTGNRDLRDRRRHHRQVRRAARRLRVDRQVASSTAATHLAA